MLSFDITDRNIRVVKGVESNGKIKISSAATLNVEEGLIENGHVKDVPNVATLINGVLKRNKMPDKEAIVSISSNLTIFKELTVVKEKNQDMSKTVKQQVQAELNLDDSYCVTYIIVGEAEEKTEGGNPIYKVLATACPFEIVNSYREVFKLLGISLRSVMVGCNCITKVLLADTKIKSKMPLLAVQIDNNFISLNLYENGQLAFSRFASIDAEDYGGSEDYVFEAVNENIFRMLQFHRSRNTGEVIENVIFYGDTHEYVRLTDELEKLDLKTSLINVPPQIHGHENLEFSLYANAIGAMFKRNRESEKINLLETELGTVIKNKVRGDNAGLGAMLALIAGSAIIVGGIWGVMALKDNGIQNDIEEVEEFINSPDTAKKLKHRDKLIAMKEKVTEYNTKINNAHDAFYSMPVVDGDKYDTIEAVLKKTAEDLSVDEPKMLKPAYANGIFSFSVEYEEPDKDKIVEQFPAQFIANLLDENFKENKGYYATAAYTGYTVKTENENADPENPGEEKVKVSFNVAAAINGRQSAYHPEESKDDAAENAAN